MKKWMLLIFSILLFGIIFWSCSDSSTDPENTPPSCEIISPLDSLHYNFGDSIIVNVDAEDPDGDTSVVYFYLDNILYGSDSNSPYSYTIKTEDLIGTHTIKVCAIDNSGARTFDERTIFLNHPPLCTITSPMNNEVFTHGNTVSINISAIDSLKNSKSISEVQLFIDDSLLFIDSEYPYTYNWNTTNYSLGSHTIKAVATDLYDLSTVNSVSISLEYITFQKTFGGSENESPGSVQQTDDGGYIITGSTISFGDGFLNVWMIKTDANGNEDWNKTFSGLFDHGESVKQTNDGGYIIIGTKQAYDPHILPLYPYDVWLIKTDADGNEEWNNIFGKIDDPDYGKSVEQTNDGGYIIVGYTSSYGNGIYDVWLIKTDADGNEEWNKTFGLFGYDYGHSVKQTNDGGYIITGYTDSYSDNNFEYDLWVIKTYANGNIEWNKLFGGIDKDYGYSVEQTTDQGFIVAGTTNSSGAGGSDGWLIKIDADGNEEWNKTFGGTESEGFRSIQQTRDGGFIITGYTNGDVWLIKTDNSGNEEWNNTFGGIDSDLGWFVEQTTDEGFIITGNRRSIGDWDIWLIKTDKYGKVK